MAKTSVGGFHYAGRSAEEVNRRAKESSRSYDSIFEDGFVVYKPKEGENIIRILPPTWLNFDAEGRMLEDAAFERWGAGWEIPVFVHNNIGPDRSTFLCLAEMKDEPCPMCEARREAVDEEERFALSPNRRALSWLIDRDDEKAGPQLWAMPHKKVFKVICARSTDRKTGSVILVDSPEEGYDIFFNVEGAGKKTADYTAVDFDRDPTPIHEDERIQTKWLKYIRENPLPEILNFQDYEYMQKVLFGRVSKKDQDEGEAQEGAPRRRRGEPAEEEVSEGRAQTRRRRSGETEEADPTADDPPQERTSRRRSEPEEEAGEPEPTTRRRAPAEPEDEPAPRRGAARREDPEDEPPPRRRRGAPVEEEEEVPAESRSARAGLERFKPRKPSERKEPEEDDAPPPRRRRV